MTMNRRVGIYLLILLLGAASGQTETVCPLKKLADEKCSGIRNQAKCSRCIVNAVDRECSGSDVDVVSGDECNLIKKCIDEIDYCTKSVSFFE
jgi:hypothetical protein